MSKKYRLRISILLALAFLSSACGFVAGQLKDKANEEALLKPGALDAPIKKQYETYSYKILGKYRVSHDWVANANPCHYKAIYSKKPTNRAAKVIRDGQINQNKWLVKVSELRPTPPFNGAGGPFQTWILPIADTGYIFIFVLGANQESLKYPESHAQMQQIFEHLVKSVRIEPLVQ